jgi:Phosphoesterase family
MPVSKSWVFLCILGSGTALAFLLYAEGCGAVGSRGTLSRPVTGLEKIQHIVFIIKQNRTFDNYFGSFPGADGATTGVTSSGQVVPLGHTSDRTPYDLIRSWNDALTAINGGKMNQFDLVKNGKVNGVLLPYTQMRQADIPNYFIYGRSLFWPTTCFPL